MTHFKYLRLARKAYGGGRGAPGDGRRCMVASRRRRATAASRWKAEGTYLAAGVEPAEGDARRLNVKSHHSDFPYSFHLACGLSFSVLPISSRLLLPFKEEVRYIDKCAVYGM